ncbi:MAG: hypothetical protein WCJ33_04510 [Pseudomonadota bacterium]
MKNWEEYWFNIKAYTPQTIPMVRLAKYLVELAKMLGEENSVHFLSIKEGSTRIGYAVENDAIHKVTERTSAISRGNSDAEAFRSFIELNKMLKADNGTAELNNAQGAEILLFPGIQEQKPEYISIKQTGEIDGKVMRVGGMGEAVPILLEVEGKQLTGCSATRNIAKPLAAFLFEPVRLYGDGYWSRKEDGEWQLDKFNVDRFEQIQDNSLSTAVMELRSIEANGWGYDAINDLMLHRHDEGNI